MLPFQGCRIPICDTEAHADQWWKSLTRCNAHRLHWDDPRRSEMWIRVWAGRIQSLGRDIPTLSQKETCSSWDKKKKHTWTSQSAATMLLPGPLWVCLALAWMGGCSAHSLFTCEPIKVHRCLGMPYNMTFFPNMMEHYDQDIAASNMEVSPHNMIYNTTLKHWFVPTLVLLGSS